MGWGSKPGEKYTIFIHKYLNNKQLRAYFREIEKSSGAGFRAKRSAGPAEKACQGCCAASGHLPGSMHSRAKPRRA